MTRARQGWVVALLLAGLALAAPLLAEEPERAGGGATIRGMVVDATGRPVPDVPVEAWTGTRTRVVGMSPGSRAEFDALFDPPKASTADPDARRTARTDDAGRFRIEGLPTIDGLRVRARPEPPLRGSVEILHEAPRPSRFLVLRVEAARAVKGRLVDDEGRGVRGWITAHAIPGRDLWLGPSWRTDFAVADGLATDDDGRFGLVAPPDARLVLHAHLPGRCYLSTAAFVGAEDDEVTLVVPTAGGASVAGRVRDRAGRPIAGARVVVHANLGTGSGYRPGHTGLARTDAEGAFEIRHLPAMDLAVVSVEAPGYALWSRMPYLTPLVEGRPLELDVALVRTAHLRVRVVDEAGAGIPGARLWFFAQTGPEGGRAWDRTVLGDADGVAVVDDMPLRGGSVQVWAPGHYLPAVPHGAALGTILGRSIPPLQAGGELGFEVVMTKGPTLRGTVVDAAGHAVAGAHLAFHMGRSDAPRGGGFQILRETTDAQGRFTFGGLPPLAHLEVTVHHEDHPSTTTEIDPNRSAGEVPLRIVLPAPGRIAGRVVDAAGRPAANVRVQCDGARDVVVSDAQGRFDFERVAPGRRRLSLGDVSLPASTLYLELAAGQRVGDVTLRHPGEEDAVLEGRVLEAGGGVSPGRTVSVRSLAAPGASGNAYVNPDGRFRLERVPPGRYTVGVDGVTTSVTIGDEGTTSTTLTLPALPPSFVVEGRVVDAEGRPVDAARVRIGFGSDGPQVARAQTAVMGGRFRACVPGAVREIAVYVDGARDVAGRPIGIAPDPTLVADPVTEPVLVTLQPVRTLRGRVVDDDGQPIADLPLTLTRQHAAARARRTYVQPLPARTDDDGRFEVGGLGDHTYVVGLPYGQDFVPPGRIELRPTDEEIEIRLLRWRPLVTVVTAPDGSPVKGCQVEGYVLGPRHARKVFTAVTNEEGRAEQVRLRPHDELTLRVVPPHPGEGVVADLCTTLAQGVSLGGAPVEVRLKVGARLGGRVLDEAGHPLPGIRVDLVIATLEPGDEGIPGIPPGFASRQNTRTDDRGAFLFRRLPTERVARVSVVPPKDADPIYFGETLQAVPTGSEQLEVVLQRGVSIEGRVPDVDPGALEGLVVRARPLLRGHPQAAFRFDGTTSTFELDGLRPGPYELHVHGGANLLYDRRHTVEAPATQVVLRVARVYDLAGAVFGAEGKTFQIEFHVSGRDPVRSQVAADGLFRLQRLLDARGSLVVYAEGSTRVALLEDVRADRGDPLIVELVEGRPIAGRIVGLTKPLAKGRVIATRGTIRLEGTLTEEGVFRTPALPPGAYALAFEYAYPPDGFVPTPEPVEAGTTDLVLEWARKP